MVAKKLIKKNIDNFSLFDSPENNEKLLIYNQKCLWDLAKFNYITKYGLFNINNNKIFNINNRIDRKYNYFDHDIKKNYPISEFLQQYNTFPADITFLYISSRLRSKAPTDML